MRSRNTATLPSFTPAAGSLIVPNTALTTTNFTLQGNNGAWVTIDPDEYEVDPFQGKVVQRTIDDSGAAVDWSAYTGGYRASWTKDVSGTRTGYTNQTLTFAEDETGFFPVGPEGQINAAFIKQLVANFLYAGGGTLVANDDGLKLYDAAWNLTAFFVSKAVTRNGEALVPGDILFGDNAALTPNLKVSGGGLTTRLATTNSIALSGNQIAAQNDSGIATSFLTVTGATGTNQDLDATGFGAGGAPFYTNCVRVTSTGNWTLRSIVTGTDGQWLYLVNESANNMTIANAGAAPAGYSAIRTFDGSSPATTNAGSALFVYNSNNGTWDLISYRG